jgi:hypothetical protein
VFLIRICNFPLLLGIAWYERQSKRNETSNFYDTVAVLAEKVYETLPRHVKRISKTACWRFCAMLTDAQRSLRAL